MKVKVHLKQLKVFSLFYFTKLSCAFKNSLFLTCKCEQAEESGKWVRTGGECHTGYSSFIPYFLEFGIKASMVILCLYFRHF